MRARARLFAADCPHRNGPIPATGLADWQHLPQGFSQFCCDLSRCICSAGERKVERRASADLKMAGDNHLLSKVLSKVIFCATLPVTRWLLLLAELDAQRNSRTYVRQFNTDPNHNKKYEMSRVRRELARGGRKRCKTHCGESAPAGENFADFSDLVNFVLTFRSKSAK